MNPQSRFRNFSRALVDLALSKTLGLRKVEPFLREATEVIARTEQVLRYLGRYTHRIAISNHRLVSFDGTHVTFRWRDYARGNKQRLMTVSAEEFIRRFLVHVLPKRFVRIRHFGFMANNQRSSSRELSRQLLGMTPVIRSTETAPSVSSWVCPKCGERMTIVQRLTAIQMMWRFVSKCFADTS